MTYRYDILKPLPAGNDEKTIAQRQMAIEHNEPLPGPDTLGIEVTEPELAVQCERGLGNIDPQHGENANPDLAAIEAAIDWSLPRDGAKLVTIRLDLDALGAMAVLLMRRDGEDLPHFPEIRARIDMIAKADKFDNSPWPGPRPMPQGADQWRTAFRLAPVVLVRNPAFVFADGTTGVKYTIAQWSAGHADLGTIADGLDRLENGWGGQPNIKGFPQARTSRLTFSDLLPVIKRHISATNTSRFREDINVGAVMRSVRDLKAPSRDEAISKRRDVRRRWRKGPELTKISLKLKVVTPILGGAAVLREIDEIDIIRAPTIRGHLRFWWRALYGHEHDSPSKMYEAESALFGRAAKEGVKEGRSPVEVRVEIVSKGELDKTDIQLYDKKDRNGRITKPETSGSYALWPAQSQREDRRNNKPYVPPAPRRVMEPQFTLTLIAPQKNETVLRNCLRAWILFGGYGSRTRRGLGSLTVVGDADQWLPEAATKDAINKLFENINDIFASRPARQFPQLGGATLLVGNAGQNPEGSWTTSLQWLKEFRQGTDSGARQPGTARHPSISNWPEADVVRNRSLSNPPKRKGVTLALAHTPRPEYQRQRAWPRAGFGLPINGQFQKKDHDGQYWDQSGKYEPRDFTLVWHDGKDAHERLSSALILKPLALANGEFVPCALWLNRSHPKNGKVIMKGDVRSGANFDANYDIPVGVPDFIENAGKATGTLRAAFCDWLEKKKKLTKVTP